MANKTNKVQETKEAKVKGTANNVGQEIAKNEATITTEVGEVVAVETPTTLTEERYNNYVEALNNTLKIARSSALVLARIYVECDELGAYKLETNEQGGQKYNDVYEWLADKFGVVLSDKQLGTYKRVVKTFGVKQADGSYQIADKFAVYGIEKLDKIQAVKEFNTRNDFETVVNGSGINELMSAKNIVNALSKWHVSQLSDEDLEKYNAKEAEKAEKAKKRESEKAEKADKVEQATKKYNVEHGKFTTTASFVTRMYTLAKDSKVSAEDFRKEFIDGFNKLENALKVQAEATANKEAEAEAK